MSYECFHCGHKSVVWDADFDFEDYCLEGEGIVHICHCTNCGASIQYNIPIPEKENEKEQPKKKKDDELEEAIVDLKRVYENALEQSFVKQPLAYALYHTWKLHDRRK